MVYPIEVKAEENVKSKSLKTVYDADHALCPVRFSMLGYKKQEWMENVPLYASMEYIRSMNFIKSFSPSLKINQNTSMTGGRLDLYMDHHLIVYGLVDASVIQIVIQKKC